MRIPASSSPLRHCRSSDLSRQSVLDTPVNQRIEHTAFPLTGTSLHWMTVPRKIYLEKPKQREATMQEKMWAYLTDSPLADFQGFSERFSEEFKKNPNPEFIQKCFIQFHVRRIAEERSDDTLEDIIPAIKGLFSHSNISEYFIRKSVSDYIELLQKTSKREEGRSAKQRKSWKNRKPTEREKYFKRNY